MLPTRSRAAGLAAVAAASALGLAACATSTGPATVPSLYGRTAAQLVDGRSFPPNTQFAVGASLVPYCLNHPDPTASGEGQRTLYAGTVTCTFEDGAITVQAIATPTERHRIERASDALTTTCAMVGPGFVIRGTAAAMVNHMVWTRTTTVYETTLHGYCTLRSVPPTGATHYSD